MKINHLRLNNLSNNNFKRGFLASFFMLRNQISELIQNNSIPTKLYLFERAIKSKKWLNFTLKIV
jgi:hypothetical protein